MRNHPTITGLKISLDGKFTYNGRPLEVREHKSHGKTLQTITIKRIVRSAPKLVLETYRPKPQDGRRWFASQKFDKGLNIQNLYWRPARILWPKQEKDVVRDWKERRNMSSIAKSWGVSDMTIFRTLERNKKSIHAPKVLTKEELENNRSSAYKYAF